MLPAYLKAPLLPLIAIALFYANASAQNVENGNFEDWEMNGETLEPTGWVTSNHSNNSELPISAHQTENACVDNYSLKLTSTAPSLEGPGPGYATQIIELDEPMTTAMLSFEYAADTLMDGAFGLVHIGGLDTSGENPVMVVSETLEITELTEGCVTENLVIDGSTTFHRVQIEFRAEPHYTGFSTEGLSVLRFDKVSLDLAVSVNDPSLSEQLTLAPNPTTGQVFLQHDNLRISSVEVIDLSGQLMRKFEVFDNSIDLADLPSATYFLKVVTSEGAVVKKVVKE